MNKLTIGIDMDGTICDFVGSFINWANYNFHLDPKLDPNMIEQTRTAEVVLKQMVNHYSVIDESILIYEGLKKIVTRSRENGKISEEDLKSGREIIFNLFPDINFCSFKEIPGAIDLIQELARDDHNLIFVTKPLFWKSSYPGMKEYWLKQHIPSHIKYDLIMVGSPKLKGLLKLDVMIDDEPRVVDSLDENTMPIIPLHPWNRQYIKDCNLLNFSVENIKDTYRVIKNNLSFFGK